LFRAHDARGGGCAVHVQYRGQCRAAARYRGGQAVKIKLSWPQLKLSRKRISLDREQMLSVAVLGPILVLCVTAMAVSLQARANAVAALSEHEEAHSTLEARLRAMGKGRGRAQTIAAAPAAAFLSAPTQGLAGAELQAYLAQLVSSQHAALVSSGIQST